MATAILFLLFVMIVRYPVSKVATRFSLPFKRKTMNILQDIPENLQEELFETLLKTKDVTLERIISKGHVTQVGEWYDQEKNEWVLLLAGSATIRFDDGEETEIGPGDYILIPAHRKHQVIKTDTTCETIWLALYYTAS
jgi:cupin 2 domain-containing protein